MNDRQRLEAIVAVVCKYLPPDGISRKQAMTEIIALVDPLPEQLEQEPVAWMQDSLELYVKDHPASTYTIPLYTAPTRKEWVGLKPDRIGVVYAHNDHFMDFALAIESILKEQNHEL